MHHARKFRCSFWAGNLLTTAMAVMPHKDPNRALDAALSLDISY